MLTLSREFQQLTYGRKHAQAQELLRSMLLRMDKEGFIPQSAPEAQALAENERFAAALIALLCDPDEKLEPATLHHLLLCKRTIGDILFTTALGPDYLVELLGVTRSGDGTLQVPARKLGALLSVLPMSMVGGMRPMLARMRPDIRLSLLMGLLCDPLVLTHEDETQRNWLIDHADLCDVSLDTLMTLTASRVASAWMFCSYADHPRRHELKAVLNRVIVRWVDRQLSRTARCTPRRASAPSQTRPRLLVVTERFREGHAMHRCYAPSIAQLRQRYHVTIIGVKEHLDQASRPLSHRAIVIDPNPKTVDKLVAQVDEMAPDLIFYPSVGMSYWAIALANLRLAPIQFMSIGHPASSFSKHMDYMILGRDVLGDPACFSEKVIVRDAPGNPVQPFPVDLPPPPPPRLKPELLRVGVPSMATKLSPAFLDLCRRLQAEAGRPVAFNFYPNRTGVSYRHVSAELRGLVQNTSVFYPMAYDKYMVSLGECDLVLASFPFGNANSTVDALLLGKPVVALEGDEPAARTDRRMLRLAGAPEWLLSNNRQSYFKVALSLVRDDDLRVRTAREILAGNPRKSLYESELALYPTDFADTVDWIFANHESIQADGRKVWMPEDREAMSAMAAKAVRPGAGPATHRGPPPRRHGPPPRGGSH